MSLKRNLAQWLGTPDSTILDFFSCGIRNPSSTQRESGTQYLRSGIHSVESNTQGCLGFDYLTWVCIY